jgi:hypothetical protein
MDPVEGRSKFFNKEVPANGMLSSKSVKGKVAMVSVAMKGSTQECSAKLVESLNNRKHFFFDIRVFTLSRRKLALEISNSRFTILHNDSAQLIITGISINVERLVVIRIAEQRDLSFEGMLVDGCLPK